MTYAPIVDRDTKLEELPVLQVGFEWMEGYTDALYPDFPGVPFWEVERAFYFEEDHYTDDEHILPGDSAPTKAPMAASRSFRHDHPYVCRTRRQAAMPRFTKVAAHRHLRRAMRLDPDFAPLRGVTGWEVI